MYSKLLLFPLKAQIDSLHAPVAVGDVVGKVVVEINGEERGSVNAIAMTGCDKKGYADILDEFIENW